jgi:Fur family ferric uptake transcriptional regulator
MVNATDDDQSPRTPPERSTQQKRALAAVLEASDGFRSAQELHAELQTQGENVALTTVYNQVRALADAGELDALRSDDGETRYRRCASGEHHHHLICRHCGIAIKSKDQRSSAGPPRREGQRLCRCNPHRRNHRDPPELRVHH